MKLFSRLIFLYTISVFDYKSTISRNLAGVLKGFRLTYSHTLDGPTRMDTGRSFKITEPLNLDLLMLKLITFRF